MFCMKCGKELPDDSKFCGFCGSVVEVDVPETVQTPVAQPEVQSAPVPPVAPAAAKPAINLPKMNLDLKKLLPIGIAAVAVVLVAVILVVVLSSLGGGSNAYVYLSDGRYTLLENLEKGDAIEIASSKSDSASGGLVSFSPDGKYVYYYTKYDEYDMTGTLCRAEYGKLKADSSKNDKYIEIIATNVSLGFTLLSEDTLLYKNGENTLYYYDGKEATQISKDVSSYYLDEAKERIVLTKGDYEEGYDLLAIRMDDLSNPTKLASECYNVYVDDDFNSIVFTKMDEEYNETIYVVGFDTEAQKLAENVYVIGNMSGAVYYVTDSGVTLNLYDYVADDSQAADAAMTEPDLESYAIPRYRYSTISGSNPVESDYEALYTSTTKDLYWFGESYWYSYSMEEALELDWGDDSDAIKAAVRDFIDKFADQADENGYIPVTAEVKTALQAINNASTDGGQWLWLCHERYQSGNTYDYDAYYAARDLYWEAEDRNELREELQDPENAHGVKALYYVKDGVQQLVSDNVVDYTTCVGGIMYNTVDMMDEKLPLAEVDDAYDVQKSFYIDREDTNYIYKTQDLVVCQMSEDAALTYSEAYENSYAYLSIYGDNVFVMEEAGALYAAKLEDSVVGSFEILSDAGTIVGEVDGVIYYLSEIYERDYAYYADLYSYVDGESTRLAQDILANNTLKVYDGKVLAYTDDSGDGYELTLFNADGETALIADGVTRYVWVEKDNLMYLSYGDLYTFDGNEKTMVAFEVDYFWCREALEDVSTLYASAYYYGY